LSIDGTTQMVGIVGYPIDYTLSPAMHNAAFAALDMNWIYLPLRVPPGEVAGAVGGLRSLGFRGFNVTIPHKVEVVRYLRGLREEAETLQAVNTVVDEGGELWGYNTDVEGFRGFLSEAGIGASDSSVLILGAGGAARAVVLALMKEGAARIFVMNRTREKAMRLFSLLKGVTATTEISVRTFDYDGSRVLRECDMVVNCTPLGNTNSEELPLLYEDFTGEKWAVDLKYGARETAFLREASAQGARRADGEGMLIFQAVASFRLWTGQAAPVEVMREALRKNMGAERE
jgi:shikimate dehydrogenase